MTADPWQSLMWRYFQVLILLHQHFNAKQTSDTIASLASAVLNDPKSSVVAKELAGSALAQATSSKQTNARMEELAARFCVRRDTVDRVKPSRLCCRAGK